MKSHLTGRFWVTVTAAVFLATLLMLPVVTNAADDPVTLTIGITADPRGLTPLYGSTHLDWIPGYRLYSGLIQAGENFEPVPDLADSWESSEDQFTWTFHLNPNATFHDGSPVTSEDVKFSILTFALEHCTSCMRGLGTVIDSIDTPDAHTVVFNLKAPYPEMLNPYDGVGDACSGVAKKELYEGTDILTNPYNFEPVGSGPFKFVEWVRGSHIILEKYEGYFREVPGIDRIVFRILGDPSARALAFENGDVDWIPFSVPASEVARLSSLPGKKVWFHPAPNGGMNELAFNMRTEPLSSKAVRKAITAAIDKQRIVDFVYFGGAEAGTAHIPRTAFSAWWQNPAAQQIEYDPELAAALLDSAGYPVQDDGWRFHINLKHTTGYSEDLKVAELIKDDLKKIGIDVTIVSLDNAAWHEQVFKNWDFDTSLVPFSGGPNPATMKRFHTTNIKRSSWANCMGFSNAEYDVLFDRMISNLDEEQRRNDLFRMQEILAEEQPVAYVVHKMQPTGLAEGKFTEEPLNVWYLGYVWMHLNRIKSAQ